MGVYESTDPTLDEMSTVGPDGVEIRLRLDGKPRDIKDEYLDAVFSRLADDPRIPIQRVKSTRRKTSPVRVPKAAPDQEE